MKKRNVIIVLLLLAACGVLIWRAHTTAGPKLLAKADYQCDGGKTIAAEFYAGTTTPKAVPGEPPKPTGFVHIALSDGRTMTLMQTISADGARYSDGDPLKPGGESFVFWSKGEGALVLENNAEKSYIGCIAVASDPGGLPNAYESGSRGFSLRYPAGYAVDESYRYQLLGPGEDIAGVKFTIPAAVAAGTNLASDTYVSVEEIPRIQTCSAAPFLFQKVEARAAADNGTDYSVASSTGAAAGNRYEEIVYALPGTNPCLAVRYYIHSGAIENYPEGAAREFDRAALLAQFDAIRRTLILR